MGFCIGLDAVVLAGIYLDAAISFDYLGNIFSDFLRHLMASCAIFVKVHNI